MTDDNSLKKPTRRGPVMYVLLAMVVAGAVVAAFLNRDQWREAWTGKHKHGVVLDESAAAKTTGLFDVRLEKRSPASAADAVAARCGLKPGPHDGYDIADRKFSVFVPKSPSADGRYGVMVGLCFARYGPPPPNWVPILEKHHLIWIGPYDNDNDQPCIQRIGLMVDAAEGAKRIWSVDPARVYLSAGTNVGPAVDTAFYYPEIFTGMVNTPDGIDFDNERAPRPASARLDQAQRNGRYAIELRITPGHPSADQYQAAFGSLGFKHIRAVDIPVEKMGHYSDYAADWFDDAVSWIESGKP